MAALLHLLVKSFQDSAYNGYICEIYIPPYIYGNQKCVLRWLLKNRHFLLPKSMSALRLKMCKRILL